MEPFTIHCTTCKARLIVKDASVIGDILACPKCQSMVQVVPPLGWKRTGSDDGAADERAPAGSAASESAPPQETKAVPQEMPAASPEGAGSKRKAAATVPPVLPPRPVVPSVAAPATAAPASAPPADVASLSNTSASNAASETPPTTAAAPTFVAGILARVRQEPYLLGGGLLGGVALGSLAWLVLALQSPRPELATSGTSSEPEPKQAVAAPERPEATPADDQQADAKASTTPQHEHPPEADDEPEAIEPVAPRAAGETEVDDANARRSTVPPAVEAVPVDATASPDARQPAPALKLEPISKNPEAASDIPQADERAGSAADASPDELDDEPLDGPSEEADEFDEAFDGRSPGEPPPLAPEEIEARLNVPLAEVEFSGVPLAHFATFVHDLAGVPVVLDEPALAAAGKSRKTPIHVKLTDTTAGETLDAALARAGLVYAIRDGRIVVGSGAAP